MIPLHEIIAWRSNAPWSNDAQVEQDYLLSKAMASIFLDPFLASQVAMRGGTALHKIHLAPAARYSEDIDLVQVGTRPAKHIERSLIRVLQPLLGKPRSSMIADVKLTVRNWLMPSKILRIEYRYRAGSSSNAIGQIKIEVNCTENKPFYEVVDLLYTPPGNQGAVTIRSYDLDEMLGTKMRALLQRDQGRDLFDLWWAWELTSRGKAKHPVDPDRVIAAFKDYMTREGSVVRSAEYERELTDKLSLSGFRSDTCRGDLE
jgi:predicted nucleotidyltransferase component of viral defense system